MCIFEMCTLLKRKYEIHTKIGMIQEFTPCIPIFGMNNIPWVCITYHLASMYFIPNYVCNSFIFWYVLHTSKASKGMYRIPMQDDIHSFKRYVIHSFKVIKYTVHTKNN